MLNNYNTPATASPETSNMKKCASAPNIILAEGQEESPPCIRRRQDVDPQMLNTLSPLVLDTLQLGKNDYGINAYEIKSGTTLNRVYNIENAEVVNSKFMKKGKKDKSKELNRIQHYPPDKVSNREQLKRTLTTKDPITTANPQIKKEELTLQQKFEEKLRKRSTTEKALNDRRAVSQPTITFTKRPLQPPPNPQSQPQPQPSSSKRKKNLESRLTTKIWQILSRDMFLLDHEKFNSHIQATNSETKEYIINIIKKCNNKQKKRLNRTKVTQTCKPNCLGNKYRDKKRAVKIAVRRRVWALAKASIKRSKHWSQFLVENHIIVDNIDIDKLDLSFIDFEALEIENKILKRIVTWLFS